MGSFSLVRYFAVASTLVIATIAGVTAWVFSRNLEAHLTEEAAAYAQELSRKLNQVVFDELVLPRARRGETFDLRDPAQLRAIDSLVTERMAGLRILTVNLFDRSGTVLYSTNPRYIGYHSVHNPGIAAALGGTSVTFFKRAELERDPLGPGHDLLETYSPFYDLSAASDPPGSSLGVLELYQDARSITGKLAQGRREILAATCTLMSALFFALFAIVRRGDLRIRQLTDALADSNRQLEERVRVRTQESERARRRLESLLDGIADGISVIAPGFAVSQYNSGIDRLFGPAAADGPRHCYERYAGRSTPCEACPAQRALAADGRAEQRYRWPTRFGEREVEVTAFSFASSAGAPGVIEVVRDVSERAELERQVIQGESLANLGSMAAGVAHEIRNPIGIITSSAQLLGETDALSERDRELLRVLRDESARVERTISEFVRFATPPRPSRSATHLEPLLERVRSALRPEAERRAVSLELDVEEKLPPLFVDGELLYRALINLVLNALQAQSHGGKVQLGAALFPGKGAQIRVADDGPGIPEGDLDRIFQPFFSSRAGGTGLGLSIVQRIVVANGGRIAVSSGDGGTMFTLTFPEGPP